MSPQTEKEKRFTTKDAKDARSYTKETVRLIRLRVLCATFVSFVVNLLAATRP
jgi:hypothetical protein